MLIVRALCFFMLVLIARPSAATENRFWLVNQSDFGAKHGFYLAFENSSPGDSPCTLGTLKLIWAVADGKDWRFLVTPLGGWQYDHDYTVRATVGPEGAQFLLDGKMIAQDTRRLQPDTGALLAGFIPSWAHGSADYWVIPTTLQVTANSGKPLVFTFPPLSAPLRLFEPQAPQRAEHWTLAPGQALTVETTFHLTRPPHDLTALAPFVDRYGQLLAADWPGKTTTDDDLHQRRAEEDRRLKVWQAGIGDYDSYGGWRKAGWHGPPSTVFQTIRHHGIWWLLTPDGNPCFYTSVCTTPAIEWERTLITGREANYAELPPHDGPLAAAWGGDSWGADPGTQSFGFSIANVIRKYGPHWHDVFWQQTAHRLKAWGFSGLGKWCNFLPGIPSLPVLNRGGVPTLAGHPDPFDPAIAARLADTLAAQITPHKNDPTVVTWSLGNEHDEIITASEIRDILGKEASVPAKQALDAEAVRGIYGGDTAKRDAAWGSPASHIPDADIETLRRFYADRYYALIEKTVKSLDPNHLYAGFWIVPGWWENEEDWRLIARHCDIIGYDNYDFHFADARLTRLLQASGKPVLCGEFSFPPQYNGQRGFGLFNPAWATDEASAGRLYARYAAEAAQNPYCVGLAWFQYRDEPLTGRGPGHGPGLVYGEDYAFGVTDIADTPKWALLTQMRRANLAAAPLRAQAERGRVK